MRTQFLSVGLIGVIAGALVATSGCDDITAGQTTDSNAPPQLSHVLIQDARYRVAFPNRASVVDLLDNYQPPACDKTIDTCLNTFLIDQFAPDVSCTSAGVCGDPFKVPATGVPVPLGTAAIGAKPDMRDPGGGVQIRLVFDKVLDNSIETVTPIMGAAPGADKMYALTSPLVELDDMAGKPVNSKFYYDNGGSPIFSSDLELIPLGPAIVIKPTVSLDAATTYTIKILNAGALKDRQGHNATALGGGALPSSFTFKTEDLTPAVAGICSAGGCNGPNTGSSSLDYPDFTAKPPVQITPNEVIQIAFFEAIQGDAATLTVVSAPPGAKPIVFADRGGDPTMCSKSMDPGGVVLDIINTDTGNITTGVPVDWPAGDYDFKVVVKDSNGRSTFTSSDYKFTVGKCATLAMGFCSQYDTTSPKAASMCDMTTGYCSMDTNDNTNHITPAQCMMK